MCFKINLKPIKYRWVSIFFKIEFSLIFKTIHQHVLNTYKNTSLSLHAFATYVVGGRVGVRSIHRARGRLDPTPPQLYSILIYTPSRTKPTRNQQPSFSSGFQDYAPVGAPKTYKNQWVSMVLQDFAPVGAPKTYKNQWFSMVLQDYAPFGAPKTYKNLWLPLVLQEYAPVGAPKTYQASRG